MAPEKQSVEMRLREDIQHLDEITLFASEILYQLEIAIRRPNFDADVFQRVMEEKLHFDETRLLLFRRAIARYKEAIRFTTQAPESEPARLLSASHLDFPKYQGIRASFDPKRPGVLVIHLKTRTDAIQFRSDAEPENMKRLRRAANIPGSNGEKMEISFVGDDREGFDGRSLALENIGITGDSELLGAIVLCEETDPDFYELTLDHEYAHAMYSALIKPYLHRYFSGANSGAHAGNNAHDHAAFSAWMNHLSQDTRDQLFDALGDTSTKRRERILIGTDIDELMSTPQGRRQARYMTTSSIPKTQQLELETHETFQDEQRLLDEMRAYGFSMPVLPANMSITPLKIAKAPRYPGQLGYIDPAIAKRYFALHINVFKAYLIDFLLHLRVLSILGTSQTLDQANRLIGNLLQHGTYAFRTKDSIDQFMHYALSIASGQLDDVFHYRLSDEVVISQKDFLKQLLPRREVFEEGLNRHYGKDWPPEAQAVLQLY